ncbi:MAG: hypothetical protein Q7S82_00880 [bacterium]|nr:hypothetical protein [bacterium]
MQNSRKVYFFKCPKCGEYQTTARTFRKFCPEAEWQKIQNTQTAVGGLIDFETQCPKCALVAKKILNKIILLRYKPSALN